MKISRHGTYANHGCACIHIQKPSVSWNKTRKMVEIRKVGVKDFNTNSRHSYTVSLSLDELAEVLDVVALEFKRTIPNTDAESQ